jgi:prepilin-type N-terminal cleavage/methylation domain-containing protein
MSKSPHAIKAFSLIELLVVVSIVAVMFSMLLPALSKSRQQAENLKCLANQRGMGATMTSYFNDNKGYIPPLANPLPDGSNPGWGYWYGSWYTMLRPYLQLNKPQSVVANQTYRNEDARQAVCPSRVVGVWTYGYPYFQYAMPWNLRWRVAGNPMTSYRVEELRDLNNTGLFLDNGTYGDSIYYMSVGMYAQNNYFTGGSQIYTPQHDASGVSQTFIDGHSEFAVLHPNSTNTVYIYPQSAKFNRRTFYGRTSAGYLSAYYQYQP